MITTKLSYACLAGMLEGLLIPALSDDKLRELVDSTSRRAADCVVQGDFEREALYRQVFSKLHEEHSRRAKIKAAVAAARPAAMRPDLTIVCPVCGKGEVDCWMDPGEPAITSGPSDSWYPGSPPGLDDYSPSCDCYDSPLVDQAAYHRALEERAMEGAVL